MTGTRVGKSSARLGLLLACLIAGAAGVMALHLMQAQGAQSMRLVSAAFAEGQPIPADYTCDGRNISPPLRWSGAPTGTRSLALICEDPDAPSGLWTHWVIYGLPGNMTELPEGVRAVENPPSGGRQGLNSFKRIGYGGPCPPVSRAHRYFFKIYALDDDVSLQTNASRADLIRALHGHVIAEGELMGVYQKRR